MRIALVQNPASTSREAVTSQKMERQMPDVEKKWSGTAIPFDIYVVARDLESASKHKRLPLFTPILFDMYVLREM